MSNAQNTIYLEDAVVRYDAAKDDEERATIIEEMCNEGFHVEAEQLARERGTGV